MASCGKDRSKLAHGVCYSVLVVTVIVLSVLLYFSKNPMDPTLPQLLKQPGIRNVTTSAIEIEWEGEFDGDGPVCGYIVNLKSPYSPSWSNVGFAPFSEEENVYLYTIDRLDADTLYVISVTILHCSGRLGERGPEINQSTDDIAPRTEIPLVPTSSASSCSGNCTECPTDNPGDDDDFWKMRFLTAVPILSCIVVLLMLFLISCCVCKYRGKDVQSVVT